MRSAAPAPAPPRACPRASPGARPAVRRQLADDPRHRRHERVRIARRAHEQPAGDALPERVIDGHRRLPHDVLVVHVGDDADDAAAECGLPQSSGSVHQILRLRASPFGKSRCAMLWLTITTRSLPRRSSSVKSRPATTGTPSAAKKPGADARAAARAGSLLRRPACSPRRRTGRADHVPASRQGTKLPTATPSTPGSWPMRRSSPR